ncbi:MAG: bifunctional alpha/beta hydrolase/OsmC family protein [Gammaproteobacteria bacterium]|nr:bifunctional alpha/beta hydrolase/OsmC family protein [Gammaproteobacteria bacterium]
MNKIKLEFENSNGEKLAGLLELPERVGDVSSFALFAHCFTCGKDIAAASRISRALATRGIAVLRFDFTGLGSSDGDFANTNFSSNIEDLILAAKALEESYRAPQILIGHSLGGAAVLGAAVKLDSVKAVVTIGAPATAQHVAHLFKEKADQIQQQGEAVVALGAREFSIKKQFLDDIDQYSSTEKIRDLDAALLVFHSPVDTIVSIDEAASIYQSARHPKSFISLDQADHLLSKADDAEYVALTIASWTSRYLELGPETDTVENPDLVSGEVLISELNQKFLRGMYTNSHFLRADEPQKYGGSDLGPNPYDLLLMSLGACTSMTLRMYANFKKLPLEDVSIRLLHERVHAEDCIDCDDKIERITRRISLAGELSGEQRQKLLEIADKCPVHRTLESDPQIVTVLED